MDTMFFMTVTGILGLFALLATTIGVDSRDMSYDADRSDYPVSLSV